MPSLISSASDCPQVYSSLLCALASRLRLSVCALVKMVHRKHQSEDTEIKGYAFLNGDDALYGGCGGVLLSKRAQLVLDGLESMRVVRRERAAYCGLGLVCKGREEARDGHIEREESLLLLCLF
jgi:hypothetical protein